MVLGEKRFATKEFLPDIFILRVHTRTRALYARTLFNVFVPCQILVKFYGFNYYICIILSIFFMTVAMFLNSQNFSKFFNFFCRPPPSNVCIIRQIVLYFNNYKRGVIYPFICRFCIKTGKITRLCHRGRAKLNEKTLFARTYMGQKGC